MDAHLSRTAARPHGPRKQRGTMLVIALIVLVALTLAGLATMRSVDTATVMAGNIAFRQSTLAAADQGLQAGFALLASTKTSLVMNLNRDGLGVATAGYYSSASAVEPDWSDSNAWTRATKLNGGTPDAAGNVVYFMVERLCRIANCAPGDTCLGATNVCGLSPGSGTSQGPGNNNFDVTSNFPLPLPHYRITSRAVGPRNSIAILQTTTR
ncbi:MAG TPA: hypothetical protein VMS92_25915 [Mycobacterium sp.]|nr:hypothetical protein [Mycobacterium sp.]